MKEVLNGGYNVHPVPIKNVMVRKKQNKTPTFIFFAWIFLVLRFGNRFFVPGGYIPTLETKQREKWCWKEKMTRWWKSWPLARGKSPMVKWLFINESVIFLSHSRGLANSCAIIFHFDFLLFFWKRKKAKGKDGTGMAGARIRPTSFCRTK